MLLAAARRLRGSSDDAVLFRGTAGALLVQLGGAGLGLVVHLLIARLLGATAYGAYALALTWIGLLAVPALLGQDVAVVRNLPGYIQRQAWAHARGLLRGTALMVAAASLVLAAGGVAVVYFLVGSQETILWNSLLAGFLLLPVLTQLQLSGAVHRALKRAASSGVFNNVLRPIFLLGAVLGLAVVLGDRLTAPVALLANCAAALLSLLLSVWFLARVWPASARDVHPTYEVRAWSILGGQLLLLSLMAIARNRLDVLVLGGLGGVGDVGPYYAAVQVSGIALYGLDAVNTILAPMIAERYGAQDVSGLQAIVRKAARWAFATSLLVGVAFALGGKAVLGLFGDGFVRAYSSLLIMLAGYCVSATFGEVGFILSMTRYQKQAAYIMGTGVVVNLVLSVILVPRFGMLGAATATALSIIVWRAIALVFVLQRMQLNPTIIGRA